MKNPCLLVDAYKLAHYFMQPKGTTMVYSTWTARSNRYMPDSEETVVFGQQYFIKKYLVDFFNEHFFNANIHEIANDFKRKVATHFNSTYIDFTRFRNLHKLGYLPIKIMGLPEGTLCPIRTPDHVMWNTHPDYAWLPQYLEDIWSCHNWQPSTAATIAYDRRCILKHYYNLTSDTPSLLKGACSDFSFRGMTSEDSAYISTSGHLTSFNKTATIDANGMIEDYYMANLASEVIGLGTPSLEHSVISQAIAKYMDELKEDGHIHVGSNDSHIITNDTLNDTRLTAEWAYMLHLLTSIQPTGPLSYVSDTYDYWGVVTRVLPLLREIIVNRDGVLIVRPDSGDPVDIICGNKKAKRSSPQGKGTIQCLWEEFGGIINSKGYKVLNNHIRVIYGDAIDRDRTIAIAQGLEANGFSIENITLGIGSYSYQYITRDTRGYAIKATNCIINGKEYPLYKDPLTDDGVKKSARGCVVVYNLPSIGVFGFKDGFSLAESLEDTKNSMVVKFEDGKQYNLQTFTQIRNGLHKDGF